MQRFITICVLHFLIVFTHAGENGTYFREERSLSTDSIHLGLKSLLSNSLGNLEAIITFVKTQIKGVVLDLGIQAFSYLKSILHGCKVRILKKLGKYTISDVFHLIFNGVIEFVNHDGNEDTQEQQPGNDEIAEASNFEPENILPNPYLLERLIMSGNQ
ncbi:jg2539 [Pararge aegeria aegeria]|uniref:Jg2539 protein n=1 Tax=Pararge aegeria aegeria TaxID=348720 RepID=A0A8S4R500_9NEOP|nr:jg2539 [Pararge aegeria aegeria]